MTAHCSQVPVTIRRRPRWRALDVRKLQLELRMSPGRGPRRPLLQSS